MDTNIDKNNWFLAYCGIISSFGVLINSLNVAKNLNVVIIMLFVGITILLLSLTLIRLIHEKVNKIQVISNSFLIISLFWLILPIMYIYDLFFPFYSEELYYLLLPILCGAGFICIFFFLSNLQKLTLNKNICTNIACGIAIICLIATSVKKQENDKIYFHKNNGKLANIVYLMLTNNIDKNYIVKNNIPERKVQLEITLANEQTKGEKLGVLAVDLLLEIIPLNHSVYEKIRDKEVFTKITSEKTLKPEELEDLINSKIVEQLGISKKEIGIHLKKIV